jgi:hypothetical protein
MKAIWGLATGSFGIWPNTLSNSESEAVGAERELPVEVVLA